MTGLAGCSTSAEVTNPFGGNGSDNGRGPAQMAAFAASSTYPDQEASGDLRATAVIDRDANTIQIVNASDQSISNAKLWVNGAFVARVPSIPAHGSVTLNRGDFYDRSGRTLAGTATTADRMELETQDELYRLQGPVFE